MNHQNPHQSFKKEEQLGTHIDTSLTPRNGSMQGQDPCLQEDLMHQSIPNNCLSQYGQHQKHTKNSIGQNQSTVSKTSLSSFKRSIEPANIREEHQEEANRSSSNDLDTLILKAQQNYALSKQVIDKITSQGNQPLTTGYPQNQRRHQQVHSNMSSMGDNTKEANSTLSGRKLADCEPHQMHAADLISDDKTARETQRHHNFVQGNHPINSPTGFSHLKLQDNETHQTLSQQNALVDEYYSLQPHQKLEQYTYEQQSQPMTKEQVAKLKEQTRQNCQNSPSGIQFQAVYQDAQQNQQKNSKLSGFGRHERNNNQAIQSQGSIASQIYVQTEGPTSDRQPPEILRDHLINNLGFKAESGVDGQSDMEQNDQQMIEYKQQMDQLMKLHRKLAQQDNLNINQNSSADSIGPESLKYHQQVQQFKQINHSDSQIASAELYICQQQSQGSKISNQEYDPDQSIANSDCNINEIQRHDVQPEHQHQTNIDGTYQFKQIHDNRKPSDQNNMENGRVDTGHFNSKSGLNQNSEMNIVNSLNIDPSCQVTHSEHSQSQGDTPKLNNFNMANDSSLSKLNQRNTKGNVFQRYDVNYDCQDGIQTKDVCQDQQSQDSQTKDENTETYRVSNDGDRIDEVDHRYNQINQSQMLGQQSASHSFNRLDPASKKDSANCSNIIQSEIQSQQDDLQENNGDIKNQSSMGPTVFSQQLQKLYDNILMVCPKFGLETGEASNGNKIQVVRDLQHHTPVLAIQLYNQVCYLYQQIKELKLAQLKQQSDGYQSQGNQMANQVQLENNMLKLQVENLKRETEFYKGQVGMLQEQFKVTVMNSQLQQPNNDGFIRELNILEARNQELQTHVRQLEHLNISLNEKNIQLDQRNKDLDGQLEIAKAKDSTQSDVGATQDKLIELVNKNNEYLDRINKLSEQVGDLNQKLKMQQDIVKFEKELNQTLKRQIDNQQEGTKKDVEQSQKDILRLQEAIQQKNQTIQHLNAQIDDFAQMTAIEFPLFGNTISKRDPMHSAQSSVNLENQNKQPKFVRMTRESNNNAMLGLLNDFDQALGLTEPMQQFEFETTDNRHPHRRGTINSNQPGSLRGKSANNLKRFQKNKRNLSQTRNQNENGIEKMFNLGQMVEQQIATAIFTDHVLNDHKQAIQKKNKRIDEQIEFVKQIEDKMSDFRKQKSDFEKNQKELTKDNEQLKIKFSQLLDQFQEYVNESEKKVEEEQTIQKEIQDKLLNDLNCTIRELEEMSQNLQRDGEEKDQIIQDLQKERDILQKDISYLKDRYQQAEDHKEQLQNVKIRSLNEEITYLKKHYMVELDVLQQENKNLRLKLRTTNSIKRQADEDGHHRQFRVSSSHSPYGRIPLHASQNQNSFERQMINLMPNDSSNRFFGPDQLDTQEQIAFVNKSNHLMDSAEQNQFNHNNQSQVSAKKFHQNCHAQNRSNQFQEFDYIDNSNRRSRARDHSQGLVENMDKAGRPISNNRSNSGNQSGYHNLRSKSYDRANHHEEIPDTQIKQKLQQNMLDYNNQSKHNVQFDLIGQGVLANQRDYRSPSQSKAMPISKNDQPNDMSDHVLDLSQGRYHHDNQSRGRAFDFKNSKQHQIGHVDRAQCSHNGSLESRDRSEQRQTIRQQCSQDDQILRNNEILLLSAKKENKILNNLKKELDEKQQLIQFQNQEIVQLRFEFEEFKSKVAHSDNDFTSQNERSRLLMDIDCVIETLNSELDRIKVNLWNDQSQLDSDKNIIHINNNVVREIDEEIHNVKSEQKLISMLQARIKKMNRILSLSSEILLLSTKQKYMPQHYRNLNQKQPFKNHSEECSMVETAPMIKDENKKQIGVDDHALIDENNSLKRTIYKYENTLAQLDSIFRRDNDKEECIYSLKKLTENQLHQILRLQKEVDAAERNSKLQAQEKKTSQQQIDSLNKEVKQLQDRLAQSNNLNGSYSKNYSQNQAQSLNQMQNQATNNTYNEKQQQLNQAMAKLREKESQLDEIRQRITVVAELFEKKPIKQKYSFEVLCDFIHDKAKRLFTKYENALKDKKASADEKVAYYQKKIQVLEVEREKDKEAKDLLKLHVIPKLSHLLQKPYSQVQVQDRINGGLVRELIDDLIFQHGKLQQLNQRLNNDKLGNIQSIHEHLAASRDQVIQHAAPIQNSRDRSPGQFGHSNGPQGMGTHNVFKGDDQLSKKEVEYMEKEKIEMNQKLEEFAQIMKDFQINQQFKADHSGQQHANIIEANKRAGHASHLNQDQL